MSEGSPNVEFKVGVLEGIAEDIGQARRPSLHTVFNHCVVHRRIEMNPSAFI